MESSGTIEAITAAAVGFSKSLDPEQRAIAVVTFDDGRRQDWHYIPKSRKGIAYKQLDPEQRRLADALLGAGLSSRGVQKVATIRSLEPILHDIEQGRGPVRDSELYYVTLFGAPQPGRPWGWSVEGHHVSLNFTMIDANRVASTPAFLGANPAEVQHGSRKGLRALAAEEDLARSLLGSFDDGQRARAVISASAPAEILSGSSRQADRLEPAGLEAGALSGTQSEILMSLLREYAGTMAPEIAERRMAGLGAAGLRSVHFAWAGGAERGAPHYYRIQGPTFLVEYDNTQNDANHIHSVWRDFNGDFGKDLLGQHYEDAHR